MTPPVSVRVSEEEIALLTRWIDQGAEWPKGSKGTLAPDRMPGE